MAIRELFSSADIYLAPEARSLVGCSSREFGKVLLERLKEKFRNVYVDLSKVVYVDAGFFTALLHARQILNLTPHRLTILRPNHKIKKLFGELGLDLFIEFAKEPPYVHSSTEWNQNFESFLETSRS